MHENTNIMHKNFLRLTLLLAMVLACLVIVQAQQMQSWNSLNARVSLADKWQLRAGHLRGYQADNRFRNHFNQTGLTVSYEAAKRLDLAAGVLFITPTGRDTRTRLFLRATHTKRISRQLNWINTLRLETNSANEPRFRQRVMLGTRLATRKRLDFANVRPAVGYQLFYNIGGRPINYYNDNKELLASQTPDGFHRGRLFLNLDFKVNDLLSIDVNYFNQQEFNLLSGPTRRMNVPNQNGTRIQRPFRPFNMLGVALTVDVDALLK